MTVFKFLKEKWANRKKMRKGFGGRPTFKAFAWSAGLMKHTKTYWLKENSPYLFWLFIIFSLIIWAFFQISPILNSSYFRVSYLNRSFSLLRKHLLPDFPHIFPGIYWIMPTLGTLSEECTQYLSSKFWILQKYIS